MRSYRPSELDRLVSEGEMTAPAQLALLPPDGAEPMLPTVRGKGRPLGSRNRRDEAYAAVLRARYGCPLASATQIAALNLLDETTVIELARRWHCAPFDAVKLAASIAADVSPYHYQKMPTAVILNPGAPGGERVEFEIGEFTEVTAEAAE